MRLLKIIPRIFIPRGHKTAPFRVRTEIGRLGIPPKEPRASARVGSISYIQVISLTLFLSFLYGFVNFIWLKNNLYPAGPDEFAHLTISIRYYLLLSNSPTELISSIVGCSGHWPPFFHVFASLFYLISGFSYTLAVETNVLYSAILFSSVYFIGYKLYGRRAAILAVLCVAFYPAIFVYSRVFNPDFALTAIVCLAAALLLAANDFKERKFSIILGFVLGLGMLVKWTFAVYICGPLLVAILCKRTKDGCDKFQQRQRLANFVFACFVGAGIALLWYIPNYMVFFNRIKMFCWDAMHYRPVLDPQLSPQSLFGFDKYFKYLMLLLNEGTTLFFFFLFSYALIFYLAKNKIRIFLLSWVMLPYFVLSLSYQKEIRFLLPVLPALALITGAGLDKISSFKQRIFWWAAVVIIGSAQFYDISFNENFQKRNVFVTTPLGPISLFYSSLRVQDDKKYGPPWKEDWHFKKLARVIKGSDPHRYTPSFGQPGFSCGIGVICEDDAASKIVSYPFVLDYYLVQDKTSTQNIRAFSLMTRRDFFDFLFLWRGFDTFVVISKYNPWPEPQDLMKKLNAFVRKKVRYFDFSLKEPLIFEVSGAFREDAFNKLQDFLKEKPADLELVDRVELAGGYSAFVYVSHKVGDTQNVFISQEDLTVSFYQGAAHFFHKGQSLTARGFETSFKVGDKDYLSTTAHWTQEKKSENELCFIGRWDDLPNVAQRLDFKFSKEGEIDFEVTLESPDKVILQKLGPVLISSSLDPGYRSWESGREEGYFHNTDTGGVVLKDAATQFLSVSGSAKPVFCFMLEVPAYSLAQIQYAKKERMLKYWTDSLILHTGQEGRSFVYVSGKIKVVSLQDRDRLRARQANAPVSFYQGAAHFFHKGQSLTARGFETSFKVGDKDYLSTTAHWTQEKKSENELCFIGRWDDLPNVAQRLDFKFSKEGEIDFEVTLESPDKVILQKLGPVLISSSLDPGYRSWESGREEGYFHNTDTGGVVLKDAATQFLSVSGSAKPVFCFMLEVPAYSLAQIQYAKKERMLKYWARPLEIFLPDGRYGGLLKGKIVFLDAARKILLRAEYNDRDSRRHSLVKRLYSLRNKRLEVFFDFGQGRVFLNGKELTQGFGLYTTVLANGFWRDSQNALWDIDKIDDKTLVARGQWLDVPLNQIWTLVLKEDDIINWDVDLEIEGPMVFKRFQSSVMLKKSFEPRTEEFLNLNKDRIFRYRVFTAGFLPGKNLVLSYNFRQRLLPGRYKDYFKGQIHVGQK